MKEPKENDIEKDETNQPEATREGREYTPATDIYEKENTILVRCDMPGVSEDQVDIRLENSELEISGTQTAGQPEGMALLVGEYETGVFRRRFSIPNLIDRDQIKARLHNGVLDIELPKAEQAKPRKIEITTGG
ncbi:MAG: Hsp20/alpha crystallin family protein [Kiritimatiellales bacterium]|nr:Hsp20/alpha crystallin family protein [Kiritimatiellales bacterium]